MDLQKFVDPLPISPTLKPMWRHSGESHYHVEMRPLRQKLHRDLPATYLWGYEGMYPGPTLEVNQGERVYVKWVNRLPFNHFLPVDFTVHGAEINFPETRTVVHVHGANVHPESDGYPEAWFTNSFTHKGPYFYHEVYQYPNRQRASTLWYHDHAMGITRLNIYAGLAGFYIIHDPIEQALPLPVKPYDIPLMIQDRTVLDDGRLYYPYQPEQGSPVYPSVTPEFFGETNLVNGKIWPYLPVEPRKYRFRILNAANSRFYRLKLSSGQPFHVIGSDGGLLESPVQVKELLISPAERYDVILDFSPFAGEKISLTNDAPAPFPNGETPDPETTGQVMQFRVELPLQSMDESRIPQPLSVIQKMDAGQAVRKRLLTFVEKKDRFNRNINLLSELRWSDPITETPKFGTVEIWSLINLTEDAHPIHIHLTHFQVLSRRKFDVSAYQNTGKIVYQSSPMPPHPYEQGWKDTVIANPGEITNVIIPFHTYSGLTVWHCHMLEHEDHEMMRPYYIIPEQNGNY